MWDLAAYSLPPTLTPVPDVHEDGVEALFYSGESYRGRPTQVFAWYGEPAAAAGDLVPAMVLIHGGGGTAFAEWVRLWTARGYAAIAMDTCGAIGDRIWGNPHRPQHAQAGPRGWGGFDQVDEPVTDQWCYHAVGAVLRAVSLLRNRPRVDPARIGVTGVSWGGFLTAVVAGVDPRLACAMPVYGCGFVHEESTWRDAFARLGIERSTTWAARFDPSTYLPHATMPMLWLNGTNDFAYFPSVWQRSYRLPCGPRTVSLHWRMAHGHGGPGENARELHVFADQVLRGGPALPTITAQGQDGRTHWAQVRGPFSLRHAELMITQMRGPWPDRVWERVPATIAADGRVTAEVPDGATAWCLNVVDFRGVTVSTEHVGE